MNKARRVLFLTVKNNHQKLLAICTISEEHFLNKTNLLIAVANEASARYVDELLWRVPYFLPHAILTEAKEVPLAIAIAPESNLNGAVALFNLSPHISNLHDQFSLVYELMDLTSLEREEKSKQRLAYYEKQKWTIEATERL